MRVFAASLVVLLASLAPAARAQDAAPAAAPAAEAAAPENVVDVVTRSGARFRGVVVKQDDRTLVLRAASGVVRELPRATVARIEAPREPVAEAAAPADAASGASAQAPLADRAALAAEKEVLAGVGVALSTADGDATVLFFPVQVGRSFRFEPEFAYLGVAGQRAILLGVGLFGTKDVAPQVRMYVGPRIEMVTGDADGGALGLSLGGEWLPVPRVALGAEARLAKTFGSQPNPTATAGLFFVRVFLN